MTGNGLAMTMLVRDEEELIGPHLAFHHALGVERAWVFVDRCRDRTAEIASRFPWVTVIARDRPDDDLHLTNHQVRVVGEAAERARSEGWRWLLHLDADEFACGHAAHSPWRWLRRVDRRVLRRASLARLLGRVSRTRPDAEMIVLAPNDVLPTRIADGHPFFTQAWTLRRGVVPRPLFDPRSGATRILRRPYGHNKGKSIVRLDAPLEPVNAHRFRPTDGREEPRTVHRGYHLHYVVIDSRTWWEKYRRLAEEPERWSSGRPVAFPKQMFKELAASMTLEEAQEYFDRWVRVRPSELIRPVVLGRVVHDPLIECVLATAGHAGSRGAAS